MLDLKYEFLCELVGDLGEPQIIGQTPHGLRIIIPVIGGSVSGVKLKGEVLPGGGDWVLFRLDGAAELDVRAAMRTDDGELVYAYYRGINNMQPPLRERVQKGEDVDPLEYCFRTTPVFETGSEKYAWLNQIICVGVGKVEPQRVRYKIYQIL